jgi:hypothetical protein
MGRSCEHSIKKDATMGPAEMRGSASACGGERRQASAIRHGMPSGRGLAVVTLVLALWGCGGASRRTAPPDRCASTTSSLQALEPTCWTKTRDGGAPLSDAGVR